MINKFFSFKFFFILTNLLIYLFGLNFYVGDKIIYTTYAFLLNFFVINSFKETGFFFEKFLSIFIWFGFCFKLNYTLIVTGAFRHPVGSFDYTPDLYDFGLKVCIIAFLTLITCSVIGKILYKFCSVNYDEDQTKIINFYTHYRKIIFFCFVVLFSILAYLNIEYNIYRKGIVTQYNINIFLISLFKWLTIFGLCSISSFIIFYEIKIKKNIFISISISLFESLLTSVGFLSRAMIFNQLALFLGVKKILNLKNWRSNLKILGTYFFLIIIFFGLSMYLVNSERQKVFWIDKQDGLKPSEYIIKDNTKTKKFHNLQIKKQKILNFERKLSAPFPLVHEFWYLIATRWVGIDAVLTVVSNPDLDFDLFKSSLNQKYDNSKYSFYDEKFLGLNEDYKLKYNENIYGITLPGFIAYSFYSGSYMVMAVIIFILYFCCFILEYIALRFSYGNFLFSSLIGQVVAYRLIHFGYLPNQSYLLVGSIILNIVAYFAIIKIIKKYN